MRKYNLSILIAFIGWSGAVIASDVEQKDFLGEPSAGRLASAPTLEKVIKDIMGIRYFSDKTNLASELAEKNLTPQDVTLEVKGALLKYKEYLEIKGLPNNIINTKIEKLNKQVAPLVDSILEAKDK